MFTIYSMGDVEFLGTILNSLAMICGTGSFKTLVLTGTVIGLLIMGVQCIMSGTRQFNLHQVFLGVIAYMCFFGPSTTVSIQDVYTSSVRQVSNVPLGAAAAGTVISNIGYGITKLFEQGYGDVGRVTESSFAESLRLIANTRAKGEDSALIYAASSSLGSGADINTSLTNYIKDCTLTKVMTNNANIEEIYKGSGTTDNNLGTSIGALRWDSPIYYTYLKMPEAMDKNLTCKEAWTIIQSGLEKASTSSEVYSELNKLVPAGDTSTDVNKLDRAINAMTTAGYGAVTAQNYILTSIVEPIFLRAAAGVYNARQDVANAMMINQAIEQRNIQWSAEQSLFMTTVRPLIAFFEGFIYAVTPVVGFLMVMGAFGVQLLIKYFQVTVWIQLWFPVLSIINLFITTSAQREFMNIYDEGMSFYALNSGTQVMQNWLATGGMLAAATPLIALFLVTGSTYAFTALTGRMAGRDHINERVAAPDAVNPSAVLSMMPQTTFSQSGGMTYSGAAVTQFDMSKGAQSAYQSAHSRVQELGMNLASQIAEGLKTGKISQEAFGRIFGKGNTLSTGLTQTAGANSTATTGTAADSGVSHSQTDAEATDASLNFSLGGQGKAGVGYDNSVLVSKNSPLPNSPAKAPISTSRELAPHPFIDGDRTEGVEDSGKPGQRQGNSLTVSGLGKYSAEVGADVSGNTKASKTFTSSQNVSGNASSTSDTKSNASFANMDQAHLTNEISRQLNTTDTKTLSEMFAKEGMEQYSKTANEYMAARSQETATRSMSEQIGSNHVVGSNTAAQLILNDHEALEDLNSTYQQMSLQEREAVQRRQDHLLNTTTPDVKQARAMAILETLSNTDRLGGIKAVSRIYYEAAQGGRTEDYSLKDYVGQLQQPALDEAKVLAERAKTVAGTGLDENLFDKQFDEGTKSVKQEMVGSDATVKNAAKRFSDNVVATGEKSQAVMQGRQLDVITEQGRAMSQATLGEKLTGATIGNVQKAAQDFFSKWFDIPNVDQLRRYQGLTSSQIAYAKAYSQGDKTVIAEAQKELIAEMQAYGKGIDPMKIQAAGEQLARSLERYEISGSPGHMALALAVNRTLHMGMFAPNEPVLEGLKVRGLESQDDHLGQEADTVPREKGATAWSHGSGQTPRTEKVKAVEEGAVDQTPVWSNNAESLKKSEPYPRNAITNEGRVKGEMTENTLRTGWNVPVATAKSFIDTEEQREDSSLTGESEDVKGELKDKARNRSDFAQDNGTMAKREDNFVVRQLSPNAVKSINAGLSMSERALGAEVQGTATERLQPTTTPQQHTTNRFSPFVNTDMTLVVKGGEADFADLGRDVAQTSNARELTMQERTRIAGSERTRDQATLVKASSSVKGAVAYGENKTPPVNPRSNGSESVASRTLGAFEADGTGTITQQAKPQSSKNSSIFARASKEAQVNPGDDTDNTAILMKAREVRIPPSEKGRSVEHQNGVRVFPFGRDSTK